MTLKLKISLATIPTYNENLGYIMLFQRNTMLVAALGFVLRFPAAKVRSLLPLRNPSGKR